MPHPARLRGFAPVLPCLAMFCAGCSGSHYIRDLRSEYQTAELPATFGEEEPRFRLTGYAAFNRQPAMRYEADSVYVHDSGIDGEIHTIHSAYSIVRRPSLLGGSAAYIGSPFFAGLAIGIPFPDPELGQGGFFAGFSPPMGSWTPMLSLGAFLNRVHTRMDYLVSARGFLSDPNVVEDTLDAVIWDLTFPVKAGLRYQAGPAALYAVAGRTGTRFWPFSGKTGDRNTVETREISAGVRLSGPGRIGFGLEGGREWTEIPDRYSGNGWKAGAFLTADFL